jgi:cytochrome c peroxidase
MLIHFRMHLTLKIRTRVTAITGSIGLLFFLAYVLFSCTQQKIEPEKQIARDLISQIDSFAALCSRLKAGVESSSFAVQQLFLQARLAYKRFEWAAEYFDPAATRTVNGPPVQEVELSGVVIEPGGLQVIEGYLFPSYDTTKRSEILRQLQLLEKACERYKMHFANVDILDWQVFDATKLEVFRIETLGITGFDNPLTLSSSAESAACLSGIQTALGYYGGGQGIPAAIQYLDRHIDFNSFDRAGFIKTYANPITTGITNLVGTLGIKMIRYNRLLNQDAKTLFDTLAFNVDAYVPDQASFVTPEKVALGRILFSDPMLSGDGTRSCQSCHQPGKAFTDGLVKNTNLGSKALLARNTPTLINAALQPSLFYDMRVRTLEDQSLTVVQNAVEMHGSLKLSVQRLWRDTMYRRLFSAAFPRPDRTGIDTLEVMNALGSYERSLVFLNSRFDEYMRGNAGAMTAGEVRGFNLFMGKARCATCHYMPLFNGNFPPRFVRTEVEVIGVPGAMKGKEIDGDLGRYAIVANEGFRHAFKTPSLRNVALTAPYMHNGVFATLEDVMDFYNKGGGVGLGIRIPNQTLPFDSLRLSGQERSDVIDFMRSLNSR